MDIFSHIFVEKIVTMIVRNRPKLKNKRGRSWPLKKFAPSLSWTKLKVVSSELGQKQSGKEINN